MSSILKFDPIYGFGWRMDEKTIEVPGQFAVAVSQSECDSATGVYTKIVGQIVSSKEYQGEWALLSIRTYGLFPQYNVRIFDASPVRSPYSLGEPDLASPKATGFAQLVA